MIKAFRCTTCKLGLIAVRNVKGRVYTRFDGAKARIDEDFEVAACDMCEEILLKLSDAERLDEFLKKGIIEVKDIHKQDI